LSAAFFNKLWLRRQSKFASEFQLNVENCSKIQDEKLRNYLSNNAETDFGRQYHFGSIRSYSDFAEAVPVLEDYSDLNPWIRSITKGKSDVLFPGKPLFFESTSGTSSASKLIPYNKALKAEFSSAVAVWMHDLYRMDPLIFSGKSYWSLSPALKEKNQTAGGIPVGTQNDSDYFDQISSFFLNRIFAVPGKISKITNPQEFYLHTWSYLLTCKKLTFISVWSPQFLIRLVDFFKENLKEICFESGVSGRWAKYIQGKIKDDGFSLELIFPELRLISCWTQGQSKVWMQKLGKICGNIPVQGKGLMSTEGVVSLPLGMNEHALAYTSHFYEFRDQNQRIHTSSDLMEGVQYEVILTTAGGLYRYNTHDTVRCTGFHHSVPYLEFLGRAGHNSDLVGEKIHGNMLHDIFAEVLAKNSLIESLYLYPVIQENQALYNLIIESETDSYSNEICEYVDNALNKNPYYYQAVKSGQLLPLRSKRVDKGFTKGLTEFYQGDKQINDGDLKLPLLFPPNYLDPLLQIENK
jgi:hypothetical protein